MSLPIVRRLPYAIVICALVVGVAHAAAHTRTVSGNPSSTVATQSAPADWKMLSRGSRLLEARQQASVSMVTPPYDSVLLARIVGARVAVCLKFSSPSVEDNGTSRTWIYRANRPATGPCALSVTTGYVAVGHKGNAKSTTTAVP